MNMSSIKKSTLLFICFLFYTPALLSNIMHDLDLDAIFNKIDRTITHQGAHTLRALLSCPTNDKNILHNRQAIIIDLLTKPDLYSQLTHALEQFNRYEKCLQHITDESNTHHATMLSEFYFSSSYFKKWNHSPLGLELRQVAYYGNLCSSVVQHTLAMIIFQQTCNHSHDHHNHDHHKKQTKSLFKKIIKSTINPIIKSETFKYAFNAWHSISQIQELYAIQSIIRNNVHRIQKIQAQMIELARSIKTIKEIHELLEFHPTLTTHIPHYKDLKNISTSSHISKKLQVLLELLEKPTFAGNPSLFSRTGNILAAYKLAYEVAPELQPALDVIGEIDAYLSCAQLVSEHQNGPLFYSFAQYIFDSKQPVLHAHNFWHPLLTENNTQLNSINLNGTSRNIIITGPNACGKSTNLKTITLCAYLAQTITIVPAKEYNQTIYKEIYSSIIVNDNIEKNLSLFAMELTNAETLLKKVDNLKENEYMFIALDELFKSTHHKKGQRVALNLLTHLYSSPYITSIISTHFEELNTLANNESYNCTNYTVNNFILKPGIGSFDESFNIVEKRIKSKLLE